MKKRKESEQNAQRSLNQITVQKEKTAEAFALAQRKYEELKQKEPAREELKQNVQRLEELQPVITSLVEQKSTMQKAEAQSERMKTNIQKFEQQLEVQISQKQQLTKELNHLEIALEQYVEKVEELTHMREDAKVLKQAYDVWEEKEKYEQEKSKRLKIWRLLLQHMKRWRAAG